MPIKKDTASQPQRWESMSLKFLHAVFLSHFLMLSMALLHHHLVESQYLHPFPKLSYVWTIDPTPTIKGIIHQEEEVREEVLHCFNNKHHFLIKLLPHHQWQCSYLHSQHGFKENPANVPIPPPRRRRWSHQMKKVRTMFLAWVTPQPFLYFSINLYTIIHNSVHISIHILNPLY